MFDFVDAVGDVQKRLDENQKARQTLLAVNEFELAVVSVQTDRAVVILCAFVVRLYPRVVAEAIEVFEKLAQRYGRWYGGISTGGLSGRKLRVRTLPSEY